MNLSIKFCFFSRRKYTGDPHTCHAHTPNGKHDKNDCMSGSFPKFRHSLSTMIFCIFSLCNLDETFFSLGRIIKHDPAVFKVEDDLLKIVLKTEPFQILIIKFFVFLRKSLTMISSSSYAMQKFPASRIPYNPYIPIKIPTAAIDISAQDKFLTINTPAARIPMHKRGIQICNCMRAFFRILFSCLSPFCDLSV